MPYDLGFRQRKLFIHTFSLWKPSTLAVGSDLGLIDPVWHITPSFAGVPGFFWSTDNVNEPRVGGITKETNIFTDDKLKLHGLQDIASGWLVKMTASLRDPDPTVGNYWTVQGAPNVDMFRAMELQVYMVLTPAPVFAADPV